MSINAPIDDITKQFANIIRSDSEIRMRRGVALPNYVDNHELVEVPNEPLGEAEAGMCWFNCLREEHKGAGQVVYGWALWRDTTPQGVMLFSQHHAVLRTANGLVDITPYVDENGLPFPPSSITFLIDERVPFDTERGAFPASLIWELETNKQYWAVRNHAKDMWDARRTYEVCRFNTSDWQSYLPK
ncbi:hypothetical protein ACQ4WP_22580 [Janthinobacterium sp. GB4P2]|uniref:hypothetical protein n=1 Tax=Janthinobacterium sp. GB4P2 TaxID=3424189 RepID=UPI003F264F74